MSLQEHYKVLLERSGDLQNEMLSDHEALVAFTIAHNATDDFEKLIAAIECRPEAALMRLAIRELQFGLLAVSLAHYRHAYISVRLFLELMLGAIYFSAYEIKLRKWMESSQDIIWSSLIDKENGPFSKSFISAFAPDFAPHGAQFLAITEKVYRECSEYVHGNMNTQAEFDKPLGFDKYKLIEWTDRLNSMRLTIIFAFIARYARTIPGDRLADLEPILLGELGTYSAIQNLYAK